MDNPARPPDRLEPHHPCRCDEQILPAVYNWVGASFQATPKQLGAITLGRAMMQALSSPLGGVAGEGAAAGCCPRSVPVPAHAWQLLAESRRIEAAAAVTIIQLASCLQPCARA